jgi:hypothetical protein
MRQTAVEWFYQRILAKDIKEVFEQAKEIEKQQIISAGNACALKQTIHNRKVDLMSLEELKDLALKDAINVGEEYYNETFGNK